MKEQIEGALKPLIGLPLCDMWRVSSLGLQIIEFGTQYPRINRRGEEIWLGDWRLHIQCSWRIIRPAFIEADSLPVYYSAGHDVRDEHMLAFFDEMDRNPIVVQAIYADSVGGVRFVLTHGFELELFTHDFGEHELWRLLPPDEDAHHFVVTGLGIEEDD